MKQKKKGEGNNVDTREIITDYAQRKCPEPSQPQRGWAAQF